ncbi:MAG: universal stress protein [Candidatus Obscuribacterales bacterium]|nr:universal stress protein [Candidatus Obscuribacterales bacterium]
MKIVVAIDGKQSADSALEFILKSKYDADSEFHLVHVIVPGFADAPVAGIPDVVAEEKAEEQGVLNDMATVLKNKLGISASTEILSGEAADVIAKVCKQIAADQAIVPSHARHGFSRIWFGSVADEIVDEAPCTVIVLKMPISK